jgi:hypothetical protein
MKRIAVLAAVLWTGVGIATSVSAQEYGVYLLCKGRVEVKGRALTGHVDLALRRNSQTALIQSSDILPVGKKMDLQITPQFYTMDISLPTQGSTAFYDWLRGRLVVWDPDLKRLSVVRLSVNRQNGKLEADMLNGAGVSLGRLRMTCDPSDNESVPEPKF